jgi:hypothetical protein
MSEVKTLTITEFLLARIADDEEAAGADPGCECLGVQFGIGHGPVCPERVLAECEAKRRIVEEHPDYGGYGESCARCAESSIDLAPWPCPTLRALASVWSDHPDYREEWRP